MWSWFVCLMFKHPLQRLGQAQALRVQYCSTFSQCRVNTGFTLTWHTQNNQFMHFVFFLAQIRYMCVCERDACISCICVCIFFHISFFICLSFLFILLSILLSIPCMFLSFPSMLPNIGSTELNSVPKCTGALKNAGKVMVRCFPWFNTNVLAHKGFCEHLFRHFLSH